MDAGVRSHSCCCKSHFTPAVKNPNKLTGHQAVLGWSHFSGMSSVPYVRRIDLCSYLCRKSFGMPSAPSCHSLPPEALPWLVTAEETSLSSAGADEVGMAHRSAAAERVGPPEVSARGWWEGWAAGPACSQMETVKAQMGEGTKAPFFFLRVWAETIQGWNEDCLSA